MVADAVIDGVEGIGLTNTTTVSVIVQTPSTPVATYLKVLAVVGVTATVLPLAPVVIPLPVAGIAAQVNV